MALAEQRQSLSFEEYLQVEEQTGLKHEYCQGQIWAMVGATDRHVTISLNLAASLKQKLQGSPCQTYISDMKLHIAAADAWFYPDVMVCCEPADRDNHLAKEHPVFIAEVLSPSTEAFDRGRKFSHYRRIASLQHYWLIDPERHLVDAYRRGNEGEWLLHGYSSKDISAPIEALACEIEMALLFEGVERVDDNDDHSDQETPRPTTN